MSINPLLYTTRRNRFYDPYSDDHFSDPFPFIDYDFGTSFISPYHNPFHNRFPIPTSFAANNAAANIKSIDTPEAHIYKAELPGFKNEDVKVCVEDGKILKINAEKIIEKEEKDGYGYHHMQRSKSVFMNQFLLPENVRGDQMKSSMENGVLTITVPKKDVNKHHLKGVEVL